MPAQYLLEAPAPEDGMGLKITIKPGHSFTIGPNKVVNAGLKNIDLIIEGPDRVERDNYHAKLRGAHQEPEHK